MWPRAVAVVVGGGYTHGCLRRDTIGSGEAKPTCESREYPVVLTRVLLLAGVIASIPVPVGAAQPTVAEHELKAAFVLRLASFTNWPEEEETEDSVPFRFGVLGDDPVGRLLIEVGEQQTIKGRPVEVVRLTMGDDLSDVLVLWIPEDYDQQEHEILIWTASTPALTIGEHRGSASHGLCIELQRDVTHVRFLVNRAACERAGLTLSAKLLELGKLVADQSGRYGGD